MIVESINGLLGSNNLHVALFALIVYTVYDLSIEKSTSFFLPGEVFVEGCCSPGRPASWPVLQDSNLRPTA